MTLKITLFLHVITVATLIGGTSLMMMYIRDSLRSNNQENILYVLRKTQYWNLSMMVPCAGIALISGIYMLLQYTHKPLWLLLKERIGSLFLLSFILIIVLYWQKKTKAATKDTSIQIAKQYLNILRVLLLVMIALTFIVTFKV